jgi:predicted peroxiredoxin
MSKLLVHLTHGPEDPTRATLAFLVAKAAKEEGHDVTIFLGANAVYLIKDSVIESVTGVGTGSLKEHFAFMLQNQVPIYLSGLSSKARGITEADLQGRNAKFADPKTLVRLNLENDRMFTY